ncbi:MAG: LPXTG cell wall anchor domain-containing protein [Gudongella sp.]|nr:LPXTG cell wall anchor domain-containing protein [Gudongella sp.]
MGEVAIGVKDNNPGTPWTAPKLPDGYKYYVVILKAGSDQSTDGQSNDPKYNVKPGDEFIFEWDDNGEIKEKDISHVIMIYVPDEESDDDDEDEGILYITDTVPQGAPEIEQQEAPIIVDDAIPQATLPKTGDGFSVLNGLIGALSLGLGLFLRKKE